MGLQIIYVIKDTHVCGRINMYLFVSCLGIGAGKKSTCAVEVKVWGNCVQCYRQVVKNVVFARNYVIHGFGE